MAIAKSFLSGNVQRSRLAALAIPGIQPDMMMITPSGNEGSLIAVQRGDFKTQQVAIEVESTLQIGYFEMHMTNACAGRNAV
jgi:Na+-transporting NADH:ubiquinone oxidoreductase subunit NqrA